jgi:hypothetical protein
MVTTSLEYRGFTAGDGTREYHLRVRRGDEVHEVTVAIPNEAFLSGRARYQDGPDVCFHKIRNELAAGGEESVPARVHLLTDEELEAYKVAHTPKDPRRRL